MKKKLITRRDFLKDGASFALAGSLMVHFPSKILANEEQKSRVVLIRNKDVLNADLKPREEIVSDMLHEAVRRLVGVSDTTEAWKQLFKSSDIVGIKSNVWHYLATPSSLEEAIVNGVKSAGVNESSVI